MRAPSLERIKKTLVPTNEERPKAHLIHRLMTLEADPTAEHWQDRFPATNKWVQSCTHRPSEEEIAINAIDELLGTHGVEGWSDDDDPRCGTHYCNTGDSYTTTVFLIAENKGWGVSYRWFLGCLADLAERED
jgi:hypothetical protein